MTSVIQAGHSFDEHFYTMYVFLFCGVLTFRDALQYVGRFRISGTREIDSHCHMFIENGHDGYHLAHEKSLEEIVKKSLSYENYIADFLKGIEVPYRAERADSYNRNRALFKREYIKAGVEYIDVLHESVTKYWDSDDPEYVEYNCRWISNQTTKVKENVKQALHSFYTDTTSYVEMTAEERMRQILDDNSLLSCEKIYLPLFEKNEVELAKMLSFKLPGIEKAGQKLVAKAIATFPKKKMDNLYRKLGPFYNLKWFLDFLLYKKYPTPDNVAYYERKHEKALEKIRRGMHSACEMLFKMMIDFKMWGKSLSEQDDTNEYFLTGHSLQLPGEFEVNPQKFIDDYIKPHVVGLCYLLEKDYETCGDEVLKIFYDLLQPSDDKKSGMFKKIRDLFWKLNVKVLKEHGSYRVVKSDMIASLCVLLGIVGNEQMSKYQCLFVPSLWKKVGDAAISFLELAENDPESIQQTTEEVEESSQPKRKRRKVEKSKENYFDKNIQDFFNRLPSPPKLSSQSQEFLNNWKIDKENINPNQDFINGVADGVVNCRGFYHGERSTDVL